MDSLNNRWEVIHKDLCKNICATIYYKNKKKN